MRNRADCWQPSRIGGHGQTPDAPTGGQNGAERDAVRAAYNYAEFLPERRRMMRAWADYLDELKASAERKSSSSAASEVQRESEMRAAVSVVGLKAEEGDFLCKS
jgi:hypothetical protein